MNLEFFRNLGRQLASIWGEIKIYQKFTVILGILCLITVLGFLVTNAASKRFVPLYPANRLLISDAAEIKEYLDSSRIAYELRGDTMILVPDGQVHRIRMDLASSGLPKAHSGQGFELFDTNTWVKGEKELQIMEMRALKGQLERDVTEYENIKSASVILDIAPPRPFGGAMYKTKASVIVTLMPGARLSASQLRSITYHVSGAVRGLQPNMVAISDTTGKLYQGLDPNGDFDNLRNAEIALEERLKSKIDGMLAMVVGAESFYSTVQVAMNREKVSQERKVYTGAPGGVVLGDPVLMSVTESGLQMSETEKAEIGTPGTNVEAVAGAVADSGSEVLNRQENRSQQYRQMAVPMDHVKTLSSPGKIDNISIGVLIDKTITVASNADLPEDQLFEEGKRNTELLREEITSQLHKILEGYGLSAVPAVDFVEFDKTRFNQMETKESMDSIFKIVANVASGLFALLAILGMIWTLNRFWSKQVVKPPEIDMDPEEEYIDFLEEPGLMEIEAMVESIKSKIHNDPEFVSALIHEWIEEDNELVLPGKH